MRRLARLNLTILVVAGFTPAMFGDELLYRYEGDVLLLDPSTGWIIAEACASTCSESVEDGAFTLRWVAGGGDIDANYHLWIAKDPQDAPPPPFWVEWSFSSATHFPGACSSDGRFAVYYDRIGEVIYAFGDAVASNSFDDVVTGLQPNAFHIYRLETLDGLNYCFAVDGTVFTCNDTLHTGNPAYLQTGGGGGCSKPPTVNKWDFIRYGRIAEGEAIVASDPPAGILDAAQYSGLDRFTVTFDQPNYVYVDEIAVGTEALRHEATKGGFFELRTSNFELPPPPAVIATRRLDNGSPETVQIVLDRPLEVGVTTRFTFATGGTPNVVEYTLLASGACCLADGTCATTYEPDCAGTFHEQTDCPPPSACCLPGGTCASLSPLCCTDHGGTPQEALCDADADGDGIDAACGDQCPEDPEKIAPGVCGCGVPDVDSDADTVPDCHDQCPSADDRMDEDGDGFPDCALGLARIPTISLWGVTILTLSLLIAAKILFRARKPTPTCVR